MPNDSAGQFPAPPSTEQSDNQLSSTPPTSLPSRDVPLTDEVAPDISTTPIASPSPEPSPLTTSTESYTEQVQFPQQTIPLESPKPQPASLPTTRRSFPALPLLLFLIAVGAIAAAYFFYQQNLALGRQLTEIERTLNQQRVQENQVTPTATPTLEASPTGTISASPTTSPTITPTTAPNSVFGDVATVLATATTKYPSAQLLMITVTGANNPATATTKYWFRQTATDKRYLYILKEAGKDLALVDQQVYVTPDDNIPTLNQLAENNGLGLDLPEAQTIAVAACPANFSCNFTPTTGQYIQPTGQANPLWQISYKPSDGSKPFVIQIDAATKKILYQNR